jgi:hypothetical protein
MSDQLLRLQKKENNSQEKEQKVLGSARSNLADFFQASARERTFRFKDLQDQILQISYRLLAGK